MKKTDSHIRISIFENISVRDSLILQKMKTGSKKFLVKIYSGWSETRGKLARKLKHGVNLSRLIDRENDQYHEVVKDYKTGNVVHECHEPLSQHKK